MYFRLSDSLSWIYFRCKAGAVLVVRGLLGIVKTSQRKVARSGADEGEISRLQRI